MKTKSQINDVLNHLQKYGTITSMEAFEKYHITRLSSTIHQLRTRHHFESNIETLEATGHNEYGNYTYAVYKWIPDEDLIPFC